MPSQVRGGGNWQSSSVTRTKTPPFLQRAKNKAEEEKKRIAGGEENPANKKKKRKGEPTEHHGKENQHVSTKPHQRTSQGHSAVSKKSTVGRSGDDRKERSVYDNVSFDITSLLSFLCVLLTSL